MSTAQPRRESAWQRFLDGKTPAQRLLLQVGAIATALAAIATLVISVGSFVAERFGGSPGGDGPAVVRTQEKSADRFVEMLIKNDGGVVPLDHQIHGVLGPADVTLEYNCRASGTCSRARVQAPAAQPDDYPPDARWYRGCWQVSMDGAGYGAADLDLELRPQGDTCPR